jgi:hypothetical protein
VARYRTHKYAKNLKKGKTFLGYLILLVLYQYQSL